MELSHSDDTIKHNGNESHAKEVTGKEDKEYDMRFPESGASSFETERSERYKHTCEESKKQRAELP